MSIEGVHSWVKTAAVVLSWVSGLLFALFLLTTTWVEFQDRGPLLSEMSEKLDEVQQNQTQFQQNINLRFNEVNENVLELYRLRCQDQGIPINSTQCPIGRRVP